MLSRLIIFVAITVTAALGGIIVRGPVISTGTSLPSPIVSLRVNEGSGTSVADSSGNSNNFTAANITWLTSQNGSNTAAQFNGTTSTLSSTSTVALSNNVITVCVWLWWDVFNQNDNLFTELSSNFNSNANCFFVDPNSGTNSKFAAAVDGTVGLFRAESITRPSAAAWHHYAFVLDNSTNAGAVKFYVDAVLTTSSVDTNTKNTNANFATNTIYVMSRGNVSLFAAGRLYSYRIYPGELTSAQVTTVMNDPQ